MLPTTPSTVDVLKEPMPQDAPTTPSTVDVLKEPKEHISTASTSPPSDLEWCFGTLSLAVFAFTSVTFAGGQVTLLWPSADLWLDVCAAFSGGCALMLVLSAILWQRVDKPEATLALCGLLLYLPYALPFRFGIGASALAITNFIGVWKAFDILIGTNKPAVSANGFYAFAVHFVSPVEYRVQHRGQLKIVAVDAGGCGRLVSKVAADVAGLALAASLRSRFSSAREPFLAENCSAALALYAEVWIIFLFLSLFCDTFSAVVGLAGFAPIQTFDSPLLRATCLSDSWSRRWNLLVHGLIRRTVFKPLLGAGIPSWLAGVLAFGMSGVFRAWRS